MKKFEKPFIKIVVLEEVLVCSTSVPVVPNVTGEGAKEGTKAGIWSNE